MKLSLIIDSKLSKAIKHMKPILRSMPKRKHKHSINVADNIKNHNKSSIYAALGHDYIERGGTTDELINHLSNTNMSQNMISQILKIITALSQDESIESDNKPLAHIKHILRTIHDDDIRNDIILIKLSDRLDNIKKRKKSLSNSYKKKSIELCSFLADAYIGSSEIFSRLLTKLNKHLS